MKIEFRNIREFPGYQATNDGRIWNETKKRFLKPFINKQNYSTVTLYKNGVKYCRRINRLIFEAFYRKLQLNEDCHHINHNRLVNRIENLVAIDQHLHASYHNSVKTPHKQSEEARRKMSESKKGIKFTEQHKQNLKQAWIIRKQRKVQ